MSILSEIQRIKTNIANAYTSAGNKGATLPATQNSANLSSTIDTIQIAPENLINSGTKVNYRISSQGYVETNSNYQSLIVPIETNTTYLITKTIISTYFRACLISSDTVQDRTSISGLIENDTGARITITTENDSKWIFIQYYRSDKDTYTEEEIFSSMNMTKQ